jgi:hypothetical protein
MALMVDFRAVPEHQLYRLRTRSDKEIIRAIDPGKVYVDRETGEEYEVVGKVLPLAPSPSNQPWSVQNLRLCGCSLEQLTPKDVNDCVHCGRRLPAMGAEE